MVPRDAKLGGQRPARTRGGLAWRAVSQGTVVYTDRGISKGMEYGIKAAEEAGKDVEYRSIGCTTPSPS